MYETEANTKIERAEEIAPGVVTSLAALRSTVLRRTVLPWSEHCTECVWPTCYSTCDLYVPRPDGRCRRFVDGMVRVPCPDAVNGYLLKIRFKQWGKLWTPGNLRLRTTREAESLERRDYRIGTALYQLPLPLRLKSIVTTKRYGMKKRAANREHRRGRTPTCFLLECLNPSESAVPISFTIRRSDSAGRIPYQKLIDIKPGFQAVRIPFDEIASVIDLSVPFSVELIPNHDEQELTLYFGLMEFVEEPPARSEVNSKIKCVVWDLDNTLWDGILVEDGAAKLQLKARIAEIIDELDRRGIIQSIASKNNEEEALLVLKQFRIDEYFLYPQISWIPKSEAIKAIARQLNIGIDSVVFVDDSEFELQQVRDACPGVRLLDSREYLGLLEMKECQVPITAESMSRRRMYQVEQNRQKSAQSFGDDYKAFLAQCDIEVKIEPLTEENLERVHELTQRTNQMNFSGNRYERQVLGKILDTSFLDTYVLSCQDRFGSYGIVGFGIVDNREPRLTDLMFSCRIQSKRVEHAFLGYIIRKYIGKTGKDFCADYRKTPRNRPSGQVFADLGMQETGVSDGVTSLVFSHDIEVPDDGIIHIVVPEDKVSVA
jgi:FkbH-like protein